MTSKRDEGAVDGRVPDAAASGVVADEGLLAAHDLALAALYEITPSDTVGAPAGYTLEPDGVVSLRFETTLAGYPEWYWTVSVARVDGAEPTVLEVELLPGEGALLAPEWIPWALRLADYQAQQVALAEAAVADARSVRVDGADAGSPQSGEEGLGDEDAAGYEADDDDLAVDVEAGDGDDLDDDDDLADDDDLDDDDDDLDEDDLEVDDLDIEGLDIDRLDPDALDPDALDPDALDPDALDPDALDPDAPGTDPDVDGSGAR